MDIIFTEIRPDGSELWRKTWELYECSFPEHERRSEAAHLEACGDAAFHPCVVAQGDSLLALLFYWEYGDGAYIEHLAVNPAMRGRSIGSAVMRAFAEREKGCTVILEIDPPVDEVSVRRRNFYERLGFVYTGQHYMHPSYRTGGTPHRLDMMSRPQAITDAQFDAFRTFMLERVASYKD